MIFFFFLGPLLARVPPLGTAIHDVVVFETYFYDVFYISDATADAIFGGGGIYRM